MADFNPAEWEFADETPKQNIKVPSTAPQEGALTKAGQFIKGLAVRAAQAPLKVLELPFNLTSGVIQAIGGPGAQQAGEEYAKAKPSAQLESLFDPQTITPEHILSRSLQYTAGNWPALFFGGVPGAATVAKDVAGSFGLAAAEKFTDSPLLQIGASVLAEKGFNKLNSILKGKPTRIEDFTSHLYKQEQDLGSKIPIEKEALQKKIDNLYKDVEGKFVNERTFSETAKNRVLSNIENASEKVKNLNFNKASDVFEVKKLLNQVWAPKESIENNIYKKLRGVFVNELDQLSNKHPQWGNKWKQADELYKIQNWQSGLLNSTNELAENGKLKKIITSGTAGTALAILGGITAGPKGIVGVPAAAKVLKEVGKGAGKLTIRGGEEVARAYKFFNSLKKTKEGEKLLWEIVADSANNDIKSLASSLNKLNKKAKDFDKEPLEDYSSIQLNPNEWEFAD